MRRYCILLSIADVALQQAQESEGGKSQLDAKKRPSVSPHADRARCRSRWALSGRARRSVLCGFLRSTTTRFCPSAGWEHDGRKGDGGSAEKCRDSMAPDARLAIV